MRWFKRKERIDRDTRPHVSKEMSPEEFAKAYDLTFQYREEVLPEAFTLEFWERSNLVQFPLQRELLRNDILDVGCGSGEIDIIFGMKGYQICGLDVSPYAIEIAKRHLGNHPELQGKVRFINGNIEEINLTDRSNTALMFHTLEHVIDPERAMAKTIDHLNPCAKVLVEVPFKKAYRDRTHLRQFTPRKLKSLLSAFSKAVEVIHLKEKRTIFAIVEI
jgi:2-polyprenyl-3-methyl-5-hydroxy-6-metoxy-1,4-benzoquinol methylase